MLIPFQKTVFIKSVLNLSALPHDSGAEIAFAGRSNAGKSSALNAITGIKNLAKTSKTPGRTQSINIFEIEPNKRLVDLPGYGFAKVPQSIKKQWESVLNDYLHTRQSLKGLCLMMDIRHPLQALDEYMIAWSIEAELPLHILLTKSDKLSRGKSLQVLQQVQKAIDDHSGLVTLQIFSAVNGEGLLSARKQLSHWL